MSISLDEHEDIKSESPSPAEEVKGLDEVAPTVYTILLVLDENLQSDNPPYERKHELTVAETRHSTVLSTMIEGDKEALVIPIPLSSVTPYAFDRCVDYLKHHGDKDIVIASRPLKTKFLKEAWADPWDSDFMDQIAADSEKGHRLYEVILGANYLSMGPLVHLVASKLALMMRGRPLDEVDRLLDLGAVQDDKERRERRAKNGQACCADEEKKSGDEEMD